MASCKTVQWSADAPYVKLTIIKKALTVSNITLAYRLEYISEKAIASEGLKTFTISMADTVIAAGTFDLNNKTGINFAGGGEKTIPITKDTKNISFKVSFAFNLPQPDGSIVDTLEASGSIPVSVNAGQAICGTPSIISAFDSNDNIVNISCLVGANGSDNTAEGVELFITCDGNEPDETNYKYKYTLWGNAGEVVSAAISFAGLPKETIARIFGNVYANTVKIAARTFGDAENVYNSAIVNKDVAFVWHGRTGAPKVTAPTLVGDMIGPYVGYKVTWEPGINGINNAVTKYSISVYNLTTNRRTATYTTTGLSYTIPSSAFAADNTYRFDISSVGGYSGFNSSVASSGPLTIKSVNKFPAPALSIADGSTVPSLELYGDKTYIDIGSGEVLKLLWNTPVATNNIIDSYTLNLSKYNPETSTFITLFESNIGDVNSFSVNTEHLLGAELAQYTLQISLVAHSKYGTAYDSPIKMISTQISKGSGTYLRVEQGYPQPIMKRSLAFVQLGYKPLTDASGKLLRDASGKDLYSKATRTQAVNTGWTLLQEAHVKDSDNIWHESNMQYEVFMDVNGELITDLSNSTVYTL